ncbi:hypothetical protein COLU111180_15850 [Cohnella lubricantis]|uniref:hypothetical protein n=1 Tax=Cohnella lubricantis TaxID=2163172 RepID=UPI001FD87BF0|nr:hypothetical protein [Cohnella lubricantis]MBP2119940.1 hypothetical protein [Cohnella lubricantis]
MNLADMLCYADIEQLTRIADTYRCECSSHSKNELIQTILTTVQRRDVLESQVEDMSLEDMRFLNSLLFEQRAAYSLEELTARAMLATPLDKTTDNQAAESPKPSMSSSASLMETGSEKPSKSKPEASKQAGRKRAKREEAQLPPEPEHSARSAIARFKRFGWLFNGFSHQTRFLYHVPDDVKRKLCEAIDRRFRDSLDVRGEPIAYRDERGLAESDARALLGYVAQNDVPLTTDHVMYKRQLQQVLELMNVAEAVPGRSGWRFGYGRRYRDYPDRFSLLYDYCCYENWLHERPEELVVTEDGGQVAADAVRIDPAAMYRFWLKLYKGPIPNLNALVQWVSRLAADWTTISSLERILLPLVRPYYYDTPRDVLNRRVLGSMLHLGLLKWGEMEDGEAVVRMTPQGRQIVAGNEIRFEDRLSWAGAGEPRFL